MRIKKVSEESKVIDIEKIDHESLLGRMIGKATFFTGVR